MSSEKIQHGYNSIEKFTEMHLATETIVESNGQVISRSRESQTVTGRSHDNLVNPELKYRSPSPASTVIPVTTTIAVTPANENNSPHCGVYVKNNSRPSSRTTFSPKPSSRQQLQQSPVSQQPQQQFSPYPAQLLSPIQQCSPRSLNQSYQTAAEQDMRGNQPYVHSPVEAHGGLNPGEGRFASQTQPQWRTNSTADSQRPGSSVQSIPRQQYCQEQQQQPRQQLQQQQQQQQQKQLQQPTYLAQQQPFYVPQMLPQQPAYSAQTTFNKTPYQNGPTSPTPTVVRYQQPDTAFHNVQRTPSRSALSKSRESVVPEGGNVDSSQFAEHLDAFLENNIPASLWIVFAVLQIIFGLISLFIAVFNFDLCYAEPKIPVYLLLSGLVLITNGSVRLCLRIPSSQQTRIVVINGRRYKQPVPNRRRSTFAVGGFVRYALEGTIIFVMLAVLVLGCIWVYGARYVQFERYRFERNYCQYTLYWMSWWSVTGHLIVLSLFIITTITILLFGAVMSK